MTQPIKIISLKNQKEFDAVSKSAKKIHGNHFICVLSATRHYEETRRADAATQLSEIEAHNSLDPHALLGITNNIPNDEKQIYLGLKVSRKIGKAVARNKVKRRFRELVRNLAQKNPKYIGYSFILIPKKSITSITYKKLLEDFNSKIQ